MGWLWDYGVTYGAVGSAVGFLVSLMGPWDRFVGLLMGLGGHKDGVGGSVMGSALGGVLG